jgi:hypothetical protein
MPFMQAHVVDHLHRESKGCDYLVLWLDCDREGENICFEVRTGTVALLSHVNIPEDTPHCFGTLDNDLPYGFCSQCATSLAVLVWKP